MSRIQVTALEVDNLSLDELIQRILEYAVRDAVSLVNYANAHGCNLACRNIAFRLVMLRAETVFCDGQGVVLGSRILGQPLKERMTPPDWIGRLYGECVRHEFRVFFVGEPQEILDTYLQKVQEEFPALEIAGGWNGFFEMGSFEEEMLIQQLVQSRPHLILTGMGMPRQEIWADRMRGRLPGGVILATGALFRWGTNGEHRNRSWWTDTGFEWLLRFVQHPIRHFKRYAIGNPIFLLRVFLQKMGFRL